jgi:hypothetical protein
LPRTTIYISSQEGTGGICLLGDVVNVFVAIDTFSRYLSVVPLINKSSKSVIAGFKQIFSKGRTPKWLRVDHGGNLTIGG